MRSVWALTRTAVVLGLLASACAGPGPAPFESGYLFDQSELRTYELHLSDEALATLDADPAAEQYVEGSMTFEGQTIEPVGIRYKGSVGAFFGCLSGRDWVRPSGQKTCTKLSMKVKINWDSTGRNPGS